MTGRLPNLFIIGVMKCGTTSLFTYLNSHPDFCGSNVKEPNFFGPKKFEFNQNNLDAYRQYFTRAEHQKYVFEASAIYINTGRRLAEFLKQQFPGCKIIILLRNPAERVFSQFKFSKDLMHIPASMPFSEYVDRCLADASSGTDPDTHVSSVMSNPYGDTVPVWMEVFGDDLWIGFFEDMKLDSAAFTDSICAWLGVRPASEMGVVFSVENPSMIPANRGLHALARRLTKAVEPALRHNPWFKRSLRRVYHLLNRTRSPLPPAAPTDLARLRDYFASSNARLRTAFARHRPHQALPAWLAEAASPD